MFGLETFQFGSKVLSCLDSQNSKGIKFGFEILFLLLSILEIFQLYLEILKTFLGINIHQFTVKVLDTLYIQ